MRRLVSGPVVAPVPTAGPGRRRGAASPSYGRSIAAGVRRSATAVAATARRWWRHRRAAGWGPLAAATAGAGAGLAAGPVAAAALAVYAAAGFVLVRHAAARRAQRRARRLAADAILGLAADLRAGLALAPAWQAAEEALRDAEAALLPGWRDRHEIGNGPVSLVAQRLYAATALAEACGAPLADVLERIDADLRATERARAVANSQAAGARASAVVLAIMPLAGIGLGVAVGVDPWHVLLHTPVGALSLGLAVALQLAGVAWTMRLADTEVMP